MHIAARVAAIAGPDEVMVSSTVKDLVAGSGLQFVDRGAYNLKGVPGESLHPVLQPTKFDFVIDLRTAKTLGLTVPAGPLAAVDEVIE